jgi:hypothetical protein
MPTQFKLTVAAVFAAATFALAAPIQAEEIVKSGIFGGENGHETSGTVQIVQLDDGYAVRFDADFTHDGTAPDATVGLGNDGYDASTNLGPLTANEGMQTYALPAGFDPAAVNEVYVWCRKFSVSLGVATLK